MILGIDEGTTGATAVILSDECKIIAKHTVDIPQHFPKPGWVEHEPEEIWKSVAGAVQGAIDKSGISKQSLKAIGITNQRETVSLFENKKPLHRFIVWQDRRTSEICAKLKGKEKRIRKLSGLTVDPYFSGSKIKWLLEELKLKKPNPSVRFRTIDSFLIERMSGEDAIEATNASRTSLMDLKKIRWSGELLSIFGIPASLCPKIYPSEGMNLKTKNCEFLPNGIPIMACLGDQQAALFGQLGWKKGVGKITHGTGAFILLNAGNTPPISKNGLVSTLALQWANGKSLYALEGSAFICGAWIQWLRDQLQIIETSAASEILARSVSNSDGVTVIPALSGMGAPFWKPNMRGAILGLTRGSSRAHLARASLEALAYQNRALIEAMKKDAKNSKTQWRVDGGAVQNDLFMQIESDVLGETLYRPRNLEATATGVALLAGLSSKVFDSEQIEKSWELDRKFEPEKSSSKIYSKAYGEWLRAVENLI